MDDTDHIYALLQRCSQASQKIRATILEKSLAKDARVARLKEKELQRESFVTERENISHRINSVAGNIALLTLQTDRAEQDCKALSDENERLSAALRDRNEFAERARRTYRDDHAAGMQDCKAQHLAFRKGLQVSLDEQRRLASSLAVMEAECRRTEPAAAAGEKG